jgi:hypothetical protein
MEITVAKGVSQQCAHQRTLSVKLLCSQCGPSPHLVEINTVRHRAFFLSQTLHVSRKFVSSRCVVVLFGTSLSEYAFLNASRTGANDFDEK